MTCMFTTYRPHRVPFVIPLPVASPKHKGPAGLSRQEGRMELWIRTGPHRIAINDDASFNPEVLDTWINLAIKAIITVDHALHHQPADTGDAP